MEDIIVIDDVIPPMHSDYILSKISTDKFPWFFMPTIVDLTSESSDYNISGFNHFLLENGNKVSDYFECFYPIVISALEQSKIKSKGLVRMRLNFHSNHKESTLEYHLPHIDSFFPHCNMIYYLNDSDGDTYIFNETNDEFSVEYDREIVSKNSFTIKQKISPKKGRVVIFPGQYYHASSYPKTSIFRSVMNVNISM